MCLQTCVHSVVQEGTFQKMNLDDVIRVILTQPLVSATQTGVVKFERCEHLGGGEGLINMPWSCILGM